MRILFLLAALHVAAVPLTACWDLAENDGISQPGNSRFGNDLKADLSVSPDGHFLVTATATDTFSLDLRSFALARLATPQNARFVFSAPGEAWFLSTPDDRASLVTRISLETGATLERRSLPRFANALTWHAASSRLAVWSLYGADGEHVTVLAPNRPPLDLSADRRLHDVSWLADGTLALVEVGVWPDGADEPTTALHFYPPTGEPWDLLVPNCASRLNVAPDGRLATLAPTFCRRDPVSIIDLAARRFVKNLPGFGPVVFTPDGQTAVAFGRRDDLAAFGLETTTAYSLLFISTSDLSLDVLELGESLPTYTVTPDGQVVLIYSLAKDASYDGILLVDVAARTLRPADGPELDLSEFVMTADGALVYLIDGGLFRLDVRTGLISFIRLPCGGLGEPAQCNPDLLNLLPDQETLVLGWRASADLAFFDIPSNRVTRTLTLPRGAEPRN